MQFKTLTEHLLQDYSGHSQGHHQSREIPSLQKVLGLQHHQPHQGDQQGRTHHVILLRRLCQRVRWVRVVQQLPACVQMIQVIQCNSAERHGGNIQTD